MRILADENVESSIVMALREAGAGSSSCVSPPSRSQRN
jgi:hypothetical protein